MIQYAIILLVFLLCWAGSWGTFTNRVRDGPWYLPLMLGVSVGTGFLFAFGARILAEKPKIFVFSLQYDVAMIVAYYLLPILFFGCRLTNGVLAGSLLVLVGLLVIHCTGE